MNSLLHQGKAEGQVFRAREGAAAENFDIAPETELHAYDMFHGVKGWAGLHRMVRARIGIFKSALEVVSGISENLIIAGTTLDGSEGSPHSRHQTVMSQLIEDLDTYSLQTNSHILIIADEHALRSQLCNDLVDFQNEHPLTQIIDTIHFVNSASSPLIQAADLITFIIRRFDSLEDRDPRAQKVTNECATIIERTRWNPNAQKPRRNGA